VTADDLSTPLGQEPVHRRRWRLPWTASQALAALLGLFLAAFLGVALFHHDPMGGEPVARVALHAPAAKTAATKAPATAASEATPAPPTPKSTVPGPGQKTITIIDGSSGARQDVVVGTRESASSSEPASSSGAFTPNVNPRLLEKSRYGMIPIAADSLTPFRAYAAGTDAERAKAAHVPTIAIVVGGLGIGTSRTADAIAALPAAVTLAFTPYGSAPEKLVEQARARHHEVLLQIPMEPFDYPDNDPGPQTLLTTLDATQNVDRLLWHLGRIQGYVGLTSFMGGRFVASDGAMQPVIKEAARRGLGYFDDGSAPRSVASTLAQAQSMPFAKADLTIDAVPTPAEIDGALGKLEKLATARGNAIGVSSGLPISIERIANWAKTLESRGIKLVPLTTAILKSKSS
jgi:polysaccharide deacetylase 2 family uncharacterized protein YibQ